MMIKIKEIEKITDLYPEWRPSDIAYIKALEWSINKLSVIFLCQLRNKLTVWPDHSKFFFEIEMTFSDVLNLKLMLNGKAFQQISGFDILDFSQNGLEGINFEIVDYENEIINFSCKEIEVNRVGMLSKLY